MMRSDTPAHVRLARGAGIIRMMIIGEESGGVEERGKARTGYARERG